MRERVHVSMARRVLEENVWRCILSEDFAEIARTCIPLQLQYFELIDLYLIGENILIIYAIYIHVVSFEYKYMLMNFLNFER